HRRAADGRHRISQVQVELRNERRDDPDMPLPAFQGAVHGHMVFDILPFLPGRANVIEEEFRRGLCAVQHDDPSEFLSLFIVHESIDEGLERRKPEPRGNKQHVLPVDLFRAESLAERPPDPHLVTGGETVEGFCHVAHPAHHHLEGAFAERRRADRDGRLANPEEGNLDELPRLMPQVPSPREPYLEESLDARHLLSADDFSDFRNVNVFCFHFVPSYRRAFITSTMLMAAVHCLTHLPHPTQNGWPFSS